MKKKFLVTSLFLSIVLVFAGKSVSAAPATFTVINTNDSGAGSLRQAILDANGNGNPSDMDIIEFNIPGSEVHTININSDLPAVTEKVTIDGYTQTGAQANTASNPEPLNSVIKIEISATSATITQGAIGVVAADSVVKGISVYDASGPDGDFSFVNVALVGSGTKLQGSYVGLKADGTTPGTYDKNCVSVVSLGAEVLVGGTNPAERNVLYSSCSIAQSGAAGSGSAGNKYYYGNYIGLAKDGVTDLSPSAADANGLEAPFQSGMNLVGGTSIVGGALVSQKNVISGNNSSGISISSADHVVQGNYIGTDYTGQVNTSITNGIGIVSVAGSNSLVGGTAANEGNTIAGVKGSGVEIASLYVQPADYLVTPSKIAILGNTIKEVTPFNLLGIGDTNLGIDISKFFDTVGNFTPDQFEERGPTPNDSSDADTGPNGTINTPVLKTAQQIGNQLTITYDLDADDAEDPANEYRVEFFANNESTIFGYGPGETFLGSATVTPGSNKTAVLNVGADYTNKSLSSTTTAVDSTTNSGFGSTSEFSRNISIGTQADFDADGSADTVENAGPNNGDGNNDGTPDRLQPTVTTYLDVSGTKYITLTTTGCSENGTVSSLDASALNAKDNGYQYDFGLTDFSLNCSRGDTVNVSLYIHDDQAEVDKYLPRKFNANTNVFGDLEGATLGREVVGTSNAIKLAYTATDGGTNDEDGEANGIIVDPVGLASSAPGNLANTGVITILAVPIGFILIIGALYTYIDYHKHKKPLVQMEPQLSKSYTYWHHLKVVSIPLVKYRLFVHVEKKTETPAAPTVQ